MVDPVETANDQIKEARESAEGDYWPTRMAVVVSFLAASLALAGLGAKASQTAYLTDHIEASDTWSAYQAKNLRATQWEAQADILASLPGADTPAVQERIRKARAEAARMRDEPGSGDGMKQLKQLALGKEKEREEAFHHYHGYEDTAGALEISIVLASVSVVTKMRALGILAASIGLLADSYGLAVFWHLT